MKKPKYINSKFFLSLFPEWNKFGEQLDTMRKVRKSLSDSQKVNSNDG